MRCGGRDWRLGSTGGIMQITLWDFMTLLMATTTFGAALSAAHHPPEPFSWMGVAIGLCAGIINAVSFRLAGDYFARRILRNTKADLQESACRNLYLAAFAWLIVSNFITYGLVKLAT